MLKSYGWPGFDSRHGKFFFLFSTESRPTLGPIQPPILRVQESIFLGVKPPRREADHSLPTSAQAKNSAAILPLPHMFSYRA
jgi:hypothetical protein